MKKKTKKLPQSFIYPEIPETQYHYGSGEVVGNVLRPDGDWRPYTPPGEVQRRNGIESSSCYKAAQLHTIATILEEQFDLPDQDFSERFNDQDNATPSGGDPLRAADSFRKQGLIPDSFLPFSDEIKSWSEFNSFKGGDKDQCEKQGKTWRQYWEPKYDVVVKREMNIEEKYARMKAAVKCSPLPFSVAQGYDSGLPKPKGASDIHLVELVHIDDQDCPWIWDTYPPFLKKLAPRYNTDFAMRWTIEKQATQEEIGIVQRILKLLAEWAGLIQKQQNTQVPTPAPKPPVEAPQPLPGPKYDWDTPVLARHSVRVICDEEGLDTALKNTLCATIGAESGWNPKAKNENKKNGKVLSTDWGICQINDYYHIGKGKSFPSVQYVLDNPEACVRWMCKQWRAGNQHLWSAYKNGSFVKYL